ncbi:extended synaptotagmin-1-like isoform X1 [Vespula squamosa]|uniref:Extended synaptotagmin-1-like isoform X1 n=1 Tax=Vespula squamosa TaxID=30214 RepID=A0ABD2A1J3_VESSQ
MEAESSEKKVSKPYTWPYMNMSSLVTSFFIKLTTAGIIWGCGYMNVNLAWLLCPIIVYVWKSEKQKDQQLRAITAQASVLANEKELIGERMDELPSWVYFPDFDRAEWLNRILYKVWPSINQYARELCKQTIEPSIVQKLADYKIKGFQFERLVLGRIPLKIYGIKVYDKNTSRNEIILDADVMYAGDCDITFSVGNIKGGIKNFQLRGLMRVVMKPIISVIPIIGGVQVFFLNVPAINFNLVGVADVLDLPGFSETLRKTIIEQIAAIVVLPNKIVIPLSEQIPVETLKVPEPEGVLRIHVIEAKHLMKKDIGMLGKGKSDPYAIINVGAQQFRTKTIDNTVNPQWDFWCEFIVEEGLGAYNTVVTQLFDKDNTGQDDPLGRATIEVNRVKKKGILDTWVSLEQAKHGMVHLRLTWLQLSKNVADLQAALIETQELRVTSMSTAVLIIYIDSAKNLPYVRGNKQPDVYLEARVDGQIQRTNTILRSCDPVWEQGFTFLVSNPESSIMHIKINDEKTAMIVGEMSYKISSLIEKDNLEVTQQPYDLQMAETDSKLVLSMSLSILKYEQPESTSEDEDDQNVNEFNKKIERQESNVSNILSSSVPPSPLKKQSSKESINSLPRNIESAPVAPIEEMVSQIEEEDIISNTAPSLSYSSSTGLIHRTPSTTSSAGESKLGRIQLTLRYSIQRQKLIIDIHRIANLPLPQNDPTNIPDPYVKLYLLPDKHKETKRKTAVIKDNCNPIFDEKFEYVVSQADLNSRVLEISVCTQKGWLSTGSNVMGQLHLNLSEIDVTKTATTWYDLQAEMKD